MEATLNGASEISFTILSMTLSLAVVFLPLVFMPGLVGRIFREFAVTIIVSIIASGVVSLTLTPLMCARMLSPRGHGSKKTIMERIANAVINPVIAFYGRTLTFFLKHRWISAVTWIVCMVGTVYLFMLVPKSFLPVGDSSFLRGVTIAPEGSSPEQMRAFQNQADAIMRQNPNVDITFTMAGLSQFLPSNQNLLLAFLKEPEDRVNPSADRRATGRSDAERIASDQSVRCVILPVPVLQISHGRAAQSAGRFCLYAFGNRCQRNL